LSRSRTGTRKNERDTTVVSPGADYSGRTTVLSLGAAVGCYGIADSVFATTTSLFLANAVHVGAVLIGVYFTGRALAGICVNLIGGWLSDQLADRKLVLALTGLAGVVGALGFTLIRNYTAVLVTGVVCFSLNSVCFSQLFAYANEFAEATGKGVASFTSAIRSAFSAAWVVGPPLGLFLLPHVGFGPVYAGCAIMFTVPTLLGYWCLPTLSSTPEKAAGQGRVSWQEIHSVVTAVPRRTWLLLSAFTSVIVADQIYLIVIALYVTKDLHRSPGLAGLMAGTCAALEIPLMIVVGRFADRIGKTRMVAFAIVVAAGFFSLLPVASSAPALLALQVANAVWTAVLLSIPLVMIQQEMPGGSGMASSLYTSAFMAAELLAGAIVGAVTAQVGYRNVFWVCAGLCALAGVMLLARSARAVHTDSR
jgi:SET family sugar efflux transporter-like MFS transporter